MRTSRILPLLALALLFAACETQPVEDQPVIDPADDLIEYHITASCEETKTTNDGNRTIWAEGDEMAAFYSSKGSTKVAKFTYDSNDSFVGSIAEPDQPCDWHAVYPYSAGITDVTAVPVSIPATSIQIGNNSMKHLAGPEFPLWGKASNVSGEPDIPMSHVSTVCCFQITNGYSEPITITGITFTAPGTVAGTFKTDLTADTFELEAVAPQSSVSLKVKGGNELNKGEEASFYLGMAPFELTGDFTIRVEANCNGKSIYSEKTVTSQMALKSGTINTIPYKFKNPTTVKEFVKLTKAPADGKWDGTYLIVNTEDNKAFAALDNNNQSYAVDVTVLNGVVKSSDEINKYAFTITCKTDDQGNPVAHGGKRLENYYAHYVQNSKHKYVFFSDNEVRIYDTNRKKGTNGTEYEYCSAFKYENNAVQFYSGGMSGNDSYQLYYSDGNFIYSKNANGYVHLYKLTDVDAQPDGKENQTLSFKEQEVTVNTGYGYDISLNDQVDLTQVLALEGAKTAVTYTSSDNNTAEVVNGTSLLLKGAGTVTITATAAEDELYHSASATCKLTIVNHKEVKGYYVKITEDPGAQKWGGDYLVVNKEGTMAFAAFSGSATSYATPVKVENDMVVADASIAKYVLSVSGGETIHTNNSSAYAYDVKNTDGKFVYVSQSAIILDDDNKGDYTYRHTFVLDDNGVQMRSAGTTSGNSRYYLTYKDNKFVYERDAETNRVQLYKWQEDAPKKGQTLTFANASVTWQVGEDQDYAIGSTYAMPQTVSGAQTTVTYSSSNTGIAEIVDNSKIKIKAVGTTTITATAAETEEYKPATASYTLTIKEVIPAGSLVDIGKFQLVNADIAPFLEEADQKYTDENWKTVSVVKNYRNGDGGDQDTHGYDHPFSYDKPLPVNIPADGHNGQTATVVVYKNVDMTDVEMTVTSTVSNEKVEVFNLIPNRSYWFTTTISGQEIMRGTFQTEGRRRYLQVSNACSADHANNLRDLGGQKTTDGRSLKYNLIFRGTNMDGTTAAEQAVITGYMGVRLDVDLRAKGSSTSSGAHQPLDKNLVDYNNNGFSSFSAISNTILKNIFTDIIDHVSAKKPCYIHCFAGADRTGYICCLIEAVCGVSEKDCSIDYELTSFSCVGTRDRCGRYNNWYWTQGINHIESTTVSGNSNPTFQEKAIQILKNAGITDAQIKALQNAMIEGN